MLGESLQLFFSHTCQAGTYQLLQPLSTHLLYVSLLLHQDGLLLSFQLALTPFSLSKMDAIIFEYLIG